MRNSDPGFLMFFPGLFFVGFPGKSKKLPDPGEIYTFLIILRSRTHCKHPVFSIKAVLNTVQMFSNIIPQTLPSIHEICPKHLLDKLPENFQTCPPNLPATSQKYPKDDVILKLRL